jgi:hypothetical protein
MSGRRKIDSDEELVRLYEAGADVTTLAARFDVGPNAIYVSLRRAGKLVSKRRVDDDAEIRRLYEAGADVATLAARRGVVRGAIYAAVRRAGGSPATRRARSIAIANGQAREIVGEDGR